MRIETNRNVDFDDIICSVGKNIIKDLSKSDVAKLSCVSKTSREACADKKIWAKFISQKFNLPDEYVLPVPQPFSLYSEAEGQRKRFNANYRNMYRQEILDYCKVLVPNPLIAYGKYRIRGDFGVGKIYTPMEPEHRERLTQLDNRLTLMPPHKLLGLALSEFEWQQRHPWKACFSSPISQWMANHANRYTQTFLPAYRNFLIEYKEKSLAQELVGASLKIMYNQSMGCLCITCAVSGVTLLIVGAALLNVPVLGVGCFVLLLSADSYFNRFNEFEVRPTPVALVEDAQELFQQVMIKHRNRDNKFRIDCNAAAHQAGLQLMRFSCH